MKINYIKYACAALPLVGMTACMDFDTPSDEFNKDTEVVVKPEPLYGDADNLEIKDVDEDAVDNAIDELSNDLAQMITAQYYLMGGKDGAMPGEHQWQYVYNLTTDAYAGYTTNDQSWGGSFESTYSFKRDFCDGPNGRFLSMKNNLGNLLNNDITNDIVEIKAIALLLFDHTAQEVTDIYGSIPYADHKANKQSNPFEFIEGGVIYYSIIKNLDDIIAVFDNFKNRPDWYKAKIQGILDQYDALTQDKQIDTWKRYANSLKLRMAMNMVKVYPDDAKKYAEEAVASGVIESQDKEVGLNPLTNCYNAHPLKVIMSSWSDSRVNASFISLLMSLDHPYTKYFIGKNSNDLVNSVTGEVTPANSTIVGLRAGIRMENGQTYYANPRVAYSQFSGEDFEFMPIYAMKWAEVDFLRAEGALRGWNMGGTVEFFYNRGIQNADCSDRFMFSSGNYESYLDDYMALEEAVPYTYVDPMDSNNNMESLTKIGVKWNESDDNETKLEKIITQKYIAVFPYSYTAWTDIRRTGYPKIFPVLNPQLGDGSLAQGEIIRRQLLPTGDIDAGVQDVQTSGLKALGGDDKQATRVFWDVDKANF